MPPGDHAPGRPPPVRIITNADDLGASPEVNQAVFALMAEGLVTSATLLARGPAVLEACELLRQFPRCSFGVHLNLTQFQPLGDPGPIAPLLGADGSFHGEIRQRKGLARLRRAVFDEFCAQVDFLRAQGLRPTHLDSHHHVHTIPWVLWPLKAVQRRFGIRKVRLSMNVYGPEKKPGRLLLLKKLAFNFALRHWPATRTTDAFMNLQAYEEKRAWLPRKFRSLEIMLHPGAPKSAPETALLQSLGRLDPGFRPSLISYHEL
jgi:chitin disaccharide deacetylase